MLVEFDPSKLTLGDIEDLEEYTGKTFEEIQDLIPTSKSKKSASVPARVMVGLTWVIGRQKDPEFTVERARGLTLLELGDEPAPNRAARRAKPKVAGP